MKQLSEKGGLSFKYAKDFTGSGDSRVERISYSAKGNVVVHASCMHNGIKRMFVLDAVSAEAAGLGKCIDGKFEYDLETVLPIVWTAGDGKHTITTAPISVEGGKKKKKQEAIA